MKVYSQPEVLEDHIAPASISNVLADVPTNIPNAPINGGIHFPIDILNIVQSEPGITIPEPQTPTLSDRFSEFNIRTVSIRPDGSLIGGPVIDFQDSVFQSLLGDTGIQSTLSDEAISLLADELSISTGVIEAIESAVGEDRSAELVGLSSDEFSRSSGSAFLTSL